MNRSIILPLLLAFILGIAHSQLVCLTKPYRQWEFFKVFMYSQMVHLQNQRHRWRMDSRSRNWGWWWKCLQWIHQERKGRLTGSKHKWLHLPRSQEHSARKLRTKIRPCSSKEHRFWWLSIFSLIQWKTFERIQAHKLRNQQGKIRCDHR